VIVPALGPVLIVGGLTVLIVAVGSAIRRSLRRQQCAVLRDRLVDAARAGELDVADGRVFGLIDWFDQVATTGRIVADGRYGTGRRDPADSLAHSLATTLLPLGPPGRADTLRSDPPPSGTGAQLRVAAQRYREQRRAGP
jgi:hypothetical protein